jgi:hypothetical protein
MLDRTRPSLSPGSAIRWYVGSLLAGVAFILTAAFAFGVHPIRAGLIYGAGLYLLAAAGRPMGLFAMLRQLRWFGLIKSDLVVRLIIAVIGVWLAVLAFFLPSDPSW